MQISSKGGQIPDLDEAEFTSVQDCSLFILCCLPRTASSTCGELASALPRGYPFLPRFENDELNGNCLGYKKVKIFLYRKVASFASICS